MAPYLHDLALGPTGVSDGNLMAPKIKPSWLAVAGLVGVGGLVLLASKSSAGGGGSTSTNGTSAPVASPTINADITGGLSTGNPIAIGPTPLAPGPSTTSTTGTSGSSGPSLSTPTTVTSSPPTPQSGTVLALGPNAPILTGQSPAYYQEQYEQIVAANPQLATTPSGLHAN
jgi:hypothetical protein